jgi:membrane glycosyltransferase
MSSILQILALRAVLADIVRALTGKKEWSILSDVIVAESGDSTALEEHLAWRRVLVVALCTVSWGGLGIRAAHTLGGGWLSLQPLVLVLFLLGLPWTLLNLWNAIIGFGILRFARNPATFANPALARTPVSAPVTTRIAICLAIRHEVVQPVFERLTALIEDLEAAGEAAAFAIHILSDSADPAIVAAELAATEALRQRFGGADFLHYRRRPLNAGFKAGNLRDFAINDGGNYDFMLVLDADSVMSAAAILRLVRVMQANPRLGILQTLVVGRPSPNAFTRVFQFGMRNGMRTHATGLAWWQGPSGPYWGHNAIIRVAPFVAHCELPTIAGKGPLAGPILSHDQVEAALMRKAGFEVRLLPDEFGSWEDNPPDLPNFIKRDLRWCQGNLQYLKLLGHVRLMPMGVFQLANAIMMYLGSVFWILLLLVGLVMAITGSHGTPAQAPARTSFAVYLFMFGFGFLPRLLGMIDVMLDSERRRQYGGIGRLLMSTATDAVFCILLGTLMAVAQTIFIGGLLFGRRVTWESQQREGRGVRLVEATRHLWPQTLFGVIMTSVLAIFAPNALLGALPTLLSVLLAIPFATITASRELGRFMQRRSLCAIPEEIDPGSTSVRICRSQAAVK